MNITTQELKKSIDSLKIDIRDWIATEQREAELRKRKVEAFHCFNPELHIIATKEQLDIANQLKALSEVKEKMNEVHAVQFGKLYQTGTTKEKKLTRKQIEEAKLVELQKQAHLRMLNRTTKK